MSAATSTSLLEALAVRIGVRTAGSPEAHAAAEAVASSFRDLGLDPRFQEFRFLGFRPEAPELTIEGAAWDAGPCLYAPPAEIAGPIRFVGKLVLRPGSFETPVFGIGDAARLYVNTRGPAVPLLPLTPPTLGGPAAWIGAVNGARLAQLEGAAATLRTGGELLPNQVDRNVLATIPGRSAEEVVVCAHVDSVWRGPGAVDNASGVEGLRRVAERFAHRQTRRSLVLAAFGAEEPGLLGSTHFVHEARLNGDLDRIAAVVNLDSIARGERLEVLASDELLPYLDGLGGNVGKQLPGSDHWPFVQAGVPSVALTYHPYAEYHTPGETIDLVDPARLDESVELACALVERLLA
jgi:aminopeptidase YwaD